MKAISREEIEKICWKHEGANPADFSENYTSHIKNLSQKIYDALPEMKKGKREKCPRCKKWIHIKDFGGIDKKGIYHKNCIEEKLTSKD